MTSQKVVAAVVVVKIHVDFRMNYFCHDCRNLRSHFGTGFGKEGDNNLLAISGCNPVTVTCVGSPPHREWMRCLLKSLSC